MLEKIDLYGDSIGEDLTSEIAETLKEIRLAKGMKYRKFICAFTENQLASVRLRFDKMILSVLYYPIMGIVPNTDSTPK
jgi:hypothetical protein